MIIDGGKSKIGIESTVVDLTNTPKILRPGIIGKKLNKFWILICQKKTNIRSPGMLKNIILRIPVLLGKKPTDQKVLLLFLEKNIKIKELFQFK